VSATDSLARLRALGNVLARRMPIVLTATIALLESVLEAANLHIATERMPTAPVTLTAEQVLEAARARGIPAFAGTAGDQLILLASLGLDLAAPGIHAALIEMQRRGDLRLARISDVDAAHADLAARGLRAEFVQESAIDDGATTFHVVTLS
jgi:hypothetical protein